MAERLSRQRVDSQELIDLAESIDLYRRTPAALSLDLLATLPHELRALADRLQYEIDAIPDDG